MYNQSYTLVVCVFVAAMQIRTLTAPLMHLEKKEYDEKDFMVDEKEKLLISMVDIASVIRSRLLQQ